MSTITSPIGEDKKWSEMTDIETLKKIKSKPRGPKHITVNHGDILEVFMAKLHKSYTVLSVHGYLSHDSHSYIYLAEIESGDDNDFNYMVGFINTNNQSRSFTAVVGEKIIDTGAIILDEMDFDKKRHTLNANETILSGKINVLFKNFKYYMHERSSEIKYMKTIDFNRDNRADPCIIKLFHNTKLADSNVRRISEHWGKSKGSSAWCFNKRVSEIIYSKLRNPLAIFDTSRQVRDIIWDRIEELQKMQTTI